MYEQVNESMYMYTTRTTQCNHKTLVQFTVHITVHTVCPINTTHVQTLRDTHYTWKRAVLAWLHSTQSCLPYIINSLCLSQHVHTLKQEP